MTPTPPSGAVNIVRLPRLPTELAGENHVGLAVSQKYRDLRLLALRIAPEAFASTYEVEVNYGMERTVQRLSNPKAIHFIAIAEPDASLSAGTALEQLSVAHWLGSVALLGPNADDTLPDLSASTDPFASMAAADATAQKSTGQLRFALNGVFVRPEARGHGLGKRLMTAALQQAKDECRLRDGHDIKCSVLVDADNDAGRALYESAGFAIVGEETYMQQPREVAAGGGELRSTERLAFRLELTIDAGTEATA